MNGDQKKEMVKAAQQYFSTTMTPDVAVRSMVLMYSIEVGMEKCRFRLSSTLILSGFRSKEWLSYLE